MTFDEQRERINSFTYIPFERRIFFGRKVGFADRKLLPTFQQKSRTYLVPTAMDAEMAFLMANQAKATSGKLVYDPFVGTWSILVSAARFGAMTMYGLPMPVALLRMDNNLPPWRSGLKKIFDAIICDPPYGVRAGGRISGGRKILRGTVDPYTVPDDKRTDHIPSTGAYSLVECVHDLFHLAARMLVMKGRLVFFFPVLRDEFY
ncbi:hypothetical protein N665_1625s0003 [Sinapis alba]|nr:hypothetical protein N665_1625s0003 [Sinapis alba]